MSDAVLPKRAGGRKRGSENKLSAAKVNAELRTMYMTSLNFVGGVQYLNWLARKHPAVYMQGLSKYMRHDDGQAGDGDLRIVVQQLNVIAAPVAGVLNSPIAEHIAPLRLVANGEVVDDEDDGGGRSRQGHRVAGVQVMTPAPTPDDEVGDE